MGRLLSVTLCIAFTSILMEKVESNSVFEFIHKCNKPIKEMREESLMVLYARELLPVPDCRLSFIGNEDDLKICVKTKHFRIMDCGIKLEYYRTVGFIEKSYSCNDTSPPEFCVENKDILYISLKNANQYTDANIKLEVSTSKPASLLWLIGVAVGVVVASFMLYHMCKQRVQDFCKKRKARVNSNARRQATQNSSNPTQSGSTNTPTSQAPKPKPAAAPKKTKSKQAAAPKKTTSKPTEAPKKTSTSDAATKNQSKPLASGGASSQTAETIQEPLLPLTPMSSGVEPNPQQSPQSSIQVQEAPQAVPTDTELYPPATSEKKSLPPELEVAIQMDQNENNRRHLPTQIEAPEYHSLFVSPPPPYTEHAEQ